MGRQAPQVGAGPILQKLAEEPRVRAVGSQDEETLQGFTSSGRDAPFTQRGL